MIEHAAWLQIGMHVQVASACQGTHRVAIAVGRWEDTTQPIRNGAEHLYFREVEVIKAIGLARPSHDCSRGCAWPNCMSHTTS
jgi:hypothetical protein